MAPIQASNAIVAYEGRSTAIVKAILNQVFSSGTQANYANHNADLILWIYEKDEWRKALRRYWMVERLVTAKAEGNKSMRATCNDAINAININDYNCPILLNKMTFNIFSHYMSMGKNENSGVYLSATRYGGIRIALTRMYHVSGKDMDQGFKKELYKFMLGMKKVIASNNRQDGISLEEGNKAVSFDVYKTL